MMNPQSLLSELIDSAKKAGADAVDCVLISSNQMSLLVRKNQLDSLERSQSIGMGLRVFMDGKVASVSTNCPDKKTCRELVEKAIAMAKITPRDPYAGLHPQGIFTHDLGKRIKSLDIYDDFEPDNEYLIENLCKAETVALENKHITNTESASADWAKNEVFLATSNGFYGTYRSSDHSLSLVVIAGKGNDMQKDYDFTHARHFSDLDPPEVIGRKAADRAVKRLNPVKKNTCRVPVVFDQPIAGSLLAHLSHAINGSSVARGSSFLKAAMGKKILNDGLNLIDDPLKSRGLSSRPFDAEGLPTEKKNFVCNGTLESWILDLATARKLGLKSTGSASRGISGAPSPTVTNLYLEPGKLSRAELIKDIDEGFLACSMMGQGFNLTTGDYSRGADGFWIRNGEICEAVSEVTLAGNLADMLLSIRPASDLVFKGSFNSPTVCVDEMMLAGL